MKQRTILTLAFLVLITPFLGLPQSWKTVLAVIFALGIGYCAYALEIKRFFTPEQLSKTKTTDTFAEGAPSQNDTSNVQS